MANGTSHGKQSDEQTPGQKSQNPSGGFDQQRQAPGREQEQGKQGQRPGQGTGQPSNKEDEEETRQRKSA